MGKLAGLVKKTFGYLKWGESPLLLLIRLSWGYQFAISGWGKLHNIEGVTKFFTSLDIPAPAFHAYLVSTTEFVGGMLLLAGLGSRFACVPLAITMGVAIYTEWAGPEKGDNVLDTVLRNVLDGDPGPFLVAVLIILIMGPGKLSLDALIERFVK